MFAEYLRVAEECLPHYVDELRGIAQGSRTPFHHVSRAHTRARVCVCVCVCVCASALRSAFVEAQVVYDDTDSNTTAQNEIILVIP